MRDELMHKLHKVKDRKTSTERELPIEKKKKGDIRIRKVRIRNIFHRTIQDFCKMRRGLKNKELLEKKREDHFKQFNTREGEITKDKRGIALRRNTRNNQGTRSIGQVLIDKEGKRKELIARILAIADRDWKLKELINEVANLMSHYLK